MAPMDIKSLLDMGLADAETLLLSDDVSLEDLEALAGEFVQGTATEQKENQLTYYRPVTAEVEKVHLFEGHTIAAFGGNGSSKTESMLVETIIEATGIIPDALLDKYPRKKLRPGAHYRFTLQNTTTHLENVILPKLQWWHWDGASAPGQGKGHWGWIPRRCLLSGDWDKSWDKKTNTLSILGGKNLDMVSKLQFMSYQQEPQSFASDALWLAAHD